MISKSSSVPKCLVLLMCLAIPDVLSTVLAPVRADTPRCSKMRVRKWRVVHPI